ncbi:MAG: hypothetical protein KAV82_15415 [Phycisphaerae bacterium]|nr:hypothetical protein [Phycisphaerae bacterium]
MLVSMVWAHSAAALTLVETTAKVLDTNHYQVETTGGSQAHLLRVVTSLTLLGSAIDADALLADGEPLVMTWRRDAGDAEVIDLSLALAIDRAPCHIEVTLRRGDGAQTPVFAAVGDVSSNGVPVPVGPSRVMVFFDNPLGPLDDIYVGNVPSGVSLRSQPPASWAIDISSLAEGEQFDLLLRSGAPGDFDNDGDVDLLDYAEFHACFESGEASDSCRFFFDLDADDDLDLHDFSIFQSWFTGANTPVSCGRRSHENQ